MIQQLFARAQGLHQAGRLEEARGLYEQVVTADPRHAEALHLLGYLWFQKGDPARALQLIGRAVDLDSRNPSYRYNRALILQQTGRLAEAAADFQAVAALQPADLGAWSDLGGVLMALGRAEEALAAYDRALQLRPESAEFNSNRGVALRLLGRLPDALAAQDRALAADPRYLEGWSNRGNVLKDLGRLEEALASYDRALALQPDLPVVLVNRANVLRELKRLDEALAGYDRAAALAPAYADAHHHRAVLMIDNQRPAEAVAGFDRALALRPDGYPEAEAARAMALLMAGDFERGLPAYERRVRLGPEAVRGLPPWLGEDPVAGLTILVWAEQGLGDTIQFCRYAPLLADRGARVVLQVQPPLSSLLRGLDGVDLIGADEAPPPFDLHAPLMSLPLALGTRLGTIPPPAPLTPDPAKVQAWSDRLGPKTGQRIGLVWSGAPGHRNDRHRSLELERLLAALPEGLDYVSLQKDVRPTDQATLDARPDVRRFGAELHDFADTAALVLLMDVVVSVDTSLAHLSGALDKDTRLLLARIGQDWRWLTERADTPWYPSIRLYRQGADNDWAGPLAAVGRDLLRL